MARMPAPRKRTGAAFLRWQEREYETNMAVKRGKLVWDPETEDTDAPRGHATWAVLKCRGKYVATTERKQELHELAIAA